MCHTELTMSTLRLDLEWPVQVMELGRVFDEGTVLCLGDRTALGRVEEVFGPITAPLYALRYTGAAGAPPAGAAAGAPVFTVDKYAAMLEPEVLQTTQVRLAVPSLVWLVRKGRIVVMLVCQH